jgi:hypothetical protein
MIDTWRPITASTEGSTCRSTNPGPAVNMVPMTAAGWMDNRCVSLVGEGEK